MPLRRQTRRPPSPSRQWLRVPHRTTIRRKTPDMTLTPVLTKRFGTNQPWKIDNYEALDGYTGLRAALAMTPDEIIDIVRNSNLRGRGGAGFPTGMKWAF